MLLVSFRAYGRRATLTDNKAKQIVEYIKIHLLSVQQDAEKLEKLMNDFDGDYDSDEYRELEITDMNNTGELYATSHLLSVATDILNEDIQGKGY
jgi:hypothetical protein